MSVRYIIRTLPSLILPAFFVALLLAILAVARYRSTPSGSLLDFSRPALGTVVTIKAIEGQGRHASGAVEKAFAEINRIDSLMTNFSSTSELANLLQRVQGAWIPVSADMMFVLGSSKDASLLSGGAFDITIGAVTRLWGFSGGGMPHLPPATRIAEELRNVGYQRIDLDLERHLVRLRPGTVLDLGGVAAGYAVDRAIEVLQAGGVSNALIDAGGDIRTLGRRQDGREWVIAVQHPRETRNLSVQGVGLSGVATSGDYQHCFQMSGRRYHHILDPGTGYPAARSISATVWAETAIQADILSTAVFVLGPQKGIELIERIGKAEALVFFEGAGTGPDAVRWRVSRGLSGKVKNP